MHQYAFFNRGLQEVSETALSAISSASLYAKGIFTTLAIRDGLPFLWEKHWERLRQNATTIGLSLGEFGQGKTRDALNSLISANSGRIGRARITFFDQAASPVWFDASEYRTSMLIITADVRPLPTEFRLTVSPYRINSTSPLAGVKSCNYLEKIMAKDEARSRGFHEAIQLNERGHMASACMANLFWLKRGKLFTPPLNTGCLGGTTREFILENVDCEEIESGIDELLNADQIFLTSAGLGVAQVSEFDDQKLDITEHPIINLIPRAV